MSARTKYGALLAAMVAAAGFGGASALSASSAAPVITGFTPTHGIVGAKVTITGSNLTGAQVQFNGVTATKVTVNSAGTQIVVLVPPETMDGPGPIGVITNGGTVASKGIFTVNPPTGATPVSGRAGSQKPKIASFAPLTAKAGAKVIIKGSYLGGALSVSFGTVKARYTIPSPTEIVATVPTGAKSGAVTVATSLGVTSSTVHFTAVAAAKAAKKPWVVTVTAGKPSELAFKLSKLSLIPAGVVTFKVTNSGVLTHDFKVCTKPTKSSKANSCVGKETPMLKHGKSATLTLTLKKGAYEFLCTVPGHASAGMKGLMGIGVTITPATTTTTTTGPLTGGGTTTTHTSGTTTTAALIGDPAAGATVFQQAGCGSCHTMAAAGSTGTSGPNLDSLGADQPTIVQQVTNGGEGMPAFSPQFSGTQINNVAAYVYQSTHH
ncbi:MAG TPA: c-type cytochrome [Gaiellaceae bacterium]|nr:c-type cytochrome [Gaiellaceae bacterium]